MEQAQQVLARESAAPRANLLVVRGEAPPIRYNATEPADIICSDNVVAREVAGEGR